MKAQFGRLLCKANIKRRKRRHINQVRIGLLDLCSYRSEILIIRRHRLINNDFDAVLYSKLADTHRNAA